MRLQLLPTSLRGRLWMMMTVLLVLFVLLAAGLLVVLGRASDSVDSVYADRVVPLVQLKDVSDAYAITIVDQVHKVVAGTQTVALAQQRIAGARQHAQQQWAAYKLTTLVDEERKLIAAIDPQLVAVNDEIDTIMALLQRGDVASLEQYRSTRLYPAFDPLTDDLDLLADVQQRVADAERQATTERFRRAIAFGTLMGAVALAVGLLLANQIGRSITGGVQRTLQLALAVAAGNTPPEWSAGRRDAAELDQLQEALVKVNARVRNVVDDARGLASEDPLTQTANRSQFQHSLREALARLRRYQNPTAVVLLDLDHLGAVNSTFGYETGDILLRLTVERTRGVLRDTDLVARLVGDRFALLMPETPLPAALLVAERVRAALAAPLPERLPAALTLSASLGVVALQADDDADLALQRAEVALLSAKACGRGRVETV